MSVDMDRISFVSRSDYRLRVLAELLDNPATPSTLAEETGIAITHISRSLKDLREEDMVELLVAEGTSKGRYYGVTETGVETASDLAALEELPSEYQ